MSGTKTSTAAAVNANSRQGAPVGRKTVLIADDDAALRRTLRVALQRDYDVITASSGHEAVDVLGRRKVDAVLLDQVMYDGDGLSVLGHTRSMDAPPPVIILSVIDDPLKAVKMMQLGAADYLPKPSSLAAIRQALREALAPPEPEDMPIPWDEAEVVSYPA